MCDIRENVDLSSIVPVMSASAVNLKLVAIYALFVICHILFGHSAQLLMLIANVLEF